MTQFSSKVQKPYFCPFLGPFGPKSREWKFFQIWDLRRKFLAKTNDWNLRKSPKTIFLGLFGPFSPFLKKWEIFLKNPAVTFEHLWTPNFMQNIKKIKLANFEKYTKKLIFSNCSAHFCSFLPYLGANRHFP